MRRELILAPSATNIRATKQVLALPFSGTEETIPCCLLQKQNSRKTKQANTKDLILEAVPCLLTNGSWQRFHAYSCLLRFLDQLGTTSMQRIYFLCLRFPSSIGTDRVGLPSNNQNNFLRTSLSDYSLLADSAASSRGATACGTDRPWIRVCSGT